MRRREVVIVAVVFLICIITFEILIPQNDPDNVEKEEELIRFDPVDDPKKQFSITNNINDENQNFNNKNINNNFLSQKVTINKCYPVNKESKYLNKFNEEMTCIPKNFVIGAAKCGTTFLHSTLKLHPQISPQKTKELSFYSKDYKKGIDFYATLFYGNIDHLRYDNSPIYFEDKEVPGRIFENVPDAKMIVILRNPTSRCFSYYHYFADTNHNIEIVSPIDNNNNNNNNNIDINDNDNIVNYNNLNVENNENGNIEIGRNAKRNNEEFSTNCQSVTFESRIAEEFEYLTRCKVIHWNPLPPPWKADIKSGCEIFPASTSCDHFFNKKVKYPVYQTSAHGCGFLLKSVYYFAMARFFEYFPRENFYFIQIEEFKEIGNEEMFNRLCDWMGIHKLNWSDYTDFSYEKEVYPPMSDETKEWLDQFFRVPNQHLNDLTHHNFTWN